jgi:predicted nucleic acid-binding OB-fold protein
VSEYSWGEFLKKTSRIGRLAQSADEGAGNIENRNTLSFQKFLPTKNKISRHNLILLNHKFFNRALRQKKTNTFESCNIITNILNVIYVPERTCAERCTQEISKKNIQ